MVPVLKEKKRCDELCSHESVKQLELATQIMEKVLQKNMQMVNLDNKKFGFMPKKRNDKYFISIKKFTSKILRNAKKLRVYFTDLRKTFDEVPRKFGTGVEAKTYHDNNIVRIKIEFRYSDEFSVKVGFYQKSVLSL